MNRRFVPLLLAALLAAGAASAASPEELRQKIAEQNEKIAEIEREIARFQTDLDTVGKEKQSLENAIRTLDISRQRLSTNIRLTEQRITATTLELERLALDIDDAGGRIVKNKAAIGEALRRMNEIESETFVEAFLEHDNLAEFWDAVESLQRVQAGVRENLAALVALKGTLEDRHRESERKKGELVNLRAELSDQKRVLDITRREQAALLSATKNRESEYQRLLADSLARKEEFERELFAYESELRIAIDPSSIPPIGKGVLAWPLDQITITQYFGNTPFASANPQIYSGKGHNGVDFRAAIGTRVKAALSGTVTATGDTDLVCPGASYGKWVLIRHANGLSTLYAHLSLIRVSPGQSVSTGEVIGYSGNTGYSTGPHLHFTLYATQGVEVRKFPSRVCRGTYTIPVADLKAYLNPLSYL